MKLYLFKKKMAFPIVFGIINSLTIDVILLNN